MALPEEDETIADDPISGEFCSGSPKLLCYGLEMTFQINCWDPVHFRGFFGMKYIRNHFQ